MDSRNRPLTVPEPAAPESTEMSAEYLRSLELQQAETLGLTRPAASPVAGVSEMIGELKAALEMIASDFETDFVLDGKVVDNPYRMHQRAWTIARTSLARADRCEGGECWHNPETGYLEGCPKHESRGMEQMMEIDAWRDKEIARWQKAIYDLCRKESGDDSIDGGGCDSGDPLDFTLAEIGQAFGIVRNEVSVASSVLAQPSAEGDGWIAQGKITKEDVDFIKSMCFQGPDMTERQERRMHRIIDELRLMAPVAKEGRES